MISCINAAQFIYTGAQNTYTQLTTNFTLYGGLKAVDIALDPVYHLADINQGCFIGAQEAYLQLAKYTGFTSTPMTLVWNLLFNFGLI